MSLAELISAMEMGLIYGIVAVGVYLTFRIIDWPDLTGDGSLVLGAASSSLLIKAGYNPWLALLCALLTGASAGLLTGLLHLRFKIIPLLSGILVAFMLYSLNLRVMGGSPNITLIGQTTVFSNAHDPFLLLCMLSGGVAVLCGAIFLTDFGLALRTVGHNQRLASNCGIHCASMTLFALMLSNALIGLGGALFSQHQGFTDVTQGAGTVISGLAAILLGERLLPLQMTALKIFTCLVGSVLYRLLVSMALYSDRLGLATQDINLMTGLMVIAVIAIPRIKRTAYSAHTPC